MSLITTHVLDTSTGTPAAGIQVTLRGPQQQQIATGTTDADGRVGDLGPESLTPGTYELVFATGEHFEARGVEHFFPQVSLAFSVEAAAEHYHVPLLLSPFGYTTYRGS
ncbi:5-hydroxyisourate hydrolase [Nesterenkonia sp. AN1]|uniref:hydroxyisourate hydrolase n=1 Tax=Nesterenkonia sp. AN1 TaxID=652017 RepID=UPI00044BCB9B|nr:hydroxyisourate hydrolase [Nesterenkonia sp. AN1]EXF25678.1 5-hydroxyisourate hydrolase [Nesterenkonia sp. AN1]